MAWINAPSILPGPLRCALGHYQFESLHSFGDGNGRVGRLVVTLQLLNSGELPEPAITLSPWFLRRREEYQAHLLAISKTGDWAPWSSSSAARSAIRRSARSPSSTTSWVG